MARLIANVHVIEPAKPGGPGEPALIPGEEYGWFGPAYGNTEDVPEHVARLIPNPKAWEGGVLPTFGTSEPESGRGHDGEPPRSGGGSGKDAWRTHAESLGLTVPDGVGRDDIVALVDQHHAAQD